MEGWIMDNSGIYVYVYIYIYWYPTMIVWNSLVLLNMVHTSQTVTGQHEPQIESLKIEDSIFSQNNQINMGYKANSKLNVRKNVQDTPKSQKVSEVWSIYIRKQIWITFFEWSPPLKHYSDIVSYIPSGSICGIFIMAF